MNTDNSCTGFLHRSKKSIEKQCRAACPAEISQYSPSNPRDKQCSRRQRAMKDTTHNLDMFTVRRQLELSTSAQLQEVYFQNPNHLVAFSKTMAKLPWAHQDPSTVRSHAHSLDDRGFSVVNDFAKHKASAQYCAGKGGDGYSVLGEANCEAPFSISCAISCGVGTFLLVEAVRGGERNARDVELRRTFLNLRSQDAGNNPNTARTSASPFVDVQSLLTSGPESSDASYQQPVTCSVPVSEVLNVQSNLLEVDLLSLGAMTYEVIHGFKPTHGSEFLRDLRRLQKDRVVFKSKETMDEPTQVSIYQSLLEDLIGHILLDGIQDSGLRSNSEVNCQTSAQKARQIMGAPMLACTDSRYPRQTSWASTSTTPSSSDISDISAAIDTSDSFVSVVLDEPAAPVASTKTCSFASRSLARLSRVFLCRAP